MVIELNKWRCLLVVGTAMNKKNLSVLWFLIVAAYEIVGASGLDVPIACVPPQLCNESIKPVNLLTLFNFPPG